MSKIIRTAVLVVLGIVWLLPAYLLVVNAMKDPTTFTSKESWIPTDFHLFENFGQALELSGIGDSIVSTLIYSIVSPTIAVLVGAAAGFAIVALRLKRGFLWFVVIFGGTVFPLQMVLLPLFDAYSRTGLFDTRVGMIMIYTVISIPFSAFVMRNFFTGVAHNVFEAAVLDILDREQERKEEERTNRRVEVERARSTRMAEDLQSKLGLTADQKGKLATIVSAHFDALRALRESNDDSAPTTRREWRERTSQVNSQTEQKLAELLSPAQFSAYQELDGEDRITGGRGRGGNAEGRGQGQEGRSTNRAAAEPPRGR